MMSALENYKIPEEFSELREVVHIVEVEMGDNSIRVEVSRSHKGPPGVSCVATYSVEGRVRDVQLIDEHEAQDPETALEYALDLLSSGKLNP